MAVRFSSHMLAHIGVTISCASAALICATLFLFFAGFSSLSLFLLIPIALSAFIPLIDGTPFVHEIGGVVSGRTLKQLTHTFYVSLAFSGAFAVILLGAWHEFT